MEDVHIGVRFSVEMKKFIKSYCRSEGITMSHLVRYSLSKELKQSELL